MSSLVKKDIERLGTVFSISLPKEHISLFSLCFDEIKRIEEKYTRFQDTSYLMKLNSHLFTWQSIDAETQNLLEFAEVMRKKTNNYFSISQKNILECFGYGKKTPFSLKKYLSNFMKRNYLLKENKIKLFKEIEIGGFGKGYALKQISIILDSNKVSNYIIDAGGDIYVKGKHIVYLESPLNKDNVFGKVILKNSSLCSSSPSRRSFNLKHHLINPKIRDSKSDLLQVFIQHIDPLSCDALSTALFVMGFEKAKFYVETYKLHAILIGEKELYSSLDFEQI